jgi:hypothetical protein
LLVFVLKSLIEENVSLFFATTMDPLKPSTLNLVEDWDAFKPNLNGYISPQKLEFWPDCKDIDVCLPPSLGVYPDQ